MDTGNETVQNTKASHSSNLENSANVAKNLPGLIALTDSLMVSN